jgi:hypothetical protein
MSNKRYDDYTKDDLMRLLESLTPGGSEYYEEPETCAERIRDYQRSIKHHMVKRKEAERQRDQLLEFSRKASELVDMLTAVKSPDDPYLVYLLPEEVQDMVLDLMNERKVVAAAKGA